MVVIFFSLNYINYFILNDIIKNNFYQKKQDKDKNNTKNIIHIYIL